MSTSEIHENQVERAKRACLSCQRRRRWCDRALPGCLMCTAAHRKCDGYVTDEVRAFVNLDGTNVSRPNKKQLLCEALANTKASGVKRKRSIHHNGVSLDHVPASSSYSSTALGGLNATSLKVDFRQHLEALWRTFVLNYCQTKDYWPPGCSLLAFRNQALDLSLVALSAQRLALSSPSSNLRLLGLTAYNNSIGLYRSLLQYQNDDGLTAILTVTSTVYALLEASLMQPEDIANFGWGKSGHFDGALVLMSKVGPYYYSTCGFHLVFKKVREMGLFLAVSRRQKTFLSTEEWMSIPWRSQPKTWRDRLYDLMLGFSEIVASSLEVGQGSSRPQAMKTWIDTAMKIEAEIGTWKSSWLKTEYPNLQIRCDCQTPAIFSCICSVPTSKFPDYDFALLQVEGWALQLLISITLSRVLATEADYTASWIAHLPIRSWQIAYYMEAASTFPAFKHTAERSSGITEGICRTIFTTWTLREYRGSRTNMNDRLSIEDSTISDD